MYRILSSFAVLFLAMHTAVSGKVPEPVFDNISVSDGLPHNTVQKIFQDSRGFMWFATKDGLCRYDGYEYTVYRESLSGKSISNSKIRCIAEDDCGNIWIGTDNGLNRIGYIDGLVSSFFSRSDRLLKSNRINELYYDAESHILWVATDKGISMYDTGLGSFLPVEAHPAFDSETNALCRGNGYMYIGSRNGLYRCDRNAGNVVRMCTEAGGGMNVFSILCDDSGDIWLGNDISLLAVVKAGSENIDIMQPSYTSSGDSFNVCSIIEKNGFLWLVTKRDGIFFYDKSEGRIAGTCPNPDINDREDRIMLTCGFLDDDGNVWLGSYYKGIYLYSDYMNHFYHIPVYRSYERLTGVIGPIVEDGDAVWLGSDDAGIVRYKPAEKSQIYYGLEENGMPLPECKPLLSCNGKLWIGTESNGIRIFDTGTCRVVRKYTTTSGSGILPGNRVNCALKDSRGNIWVGVNGGRGGVCRFDAEKEEFTTVCPDAEMGGVSVKDVYFISEISDGILWLGTRNDGIYSYDIDKDSFEPIPIMGRNDLSVSYIYEDSLGRVWVGTFGQGLICMDRSGQVRKVFGMYDGRIGSNVCGIIEDKSGRIWISSFYGIACYDESRGDFVDYDINNGFNLSHVKPMSCLCPANGRIYFGGGNGLVEIDPDMMMTVGGTVPRAALTGLLVHNQPVDASLRAEMLLERSVNLKYNQDNITFIFAALGYVYPDKNQYRYMLEGIDDEWSLPGTRRSVTYSNLSAGRYRFMLSVSDGNGRWSEPENLLSVNISPAPWNTWWAYAAYLLVFLSVAAVLIYYKVTKIRLEHDLEIKRIEEKNIERMHRFRLDLFTNFSHEIRTPLTLVSGSVSDLLANGSCADSNALLGVQRNVGKIMELVNQLMDFRKHDSGRMELAASCHDLIPFIKEMGVVFGELSRNWSHPLRIRYPDGELKVWYNQSLMEKVFNNVLMNAFKYSEKGSTVLLEAEVVAVSESPYHERVDRPVDEAVLLSVYNSGDHIPEDRVEEIFEPFYRLKNSLNQQGTGIGLSFNRMIMRLHHGDIWVENTDDGVVFRFLLPMGKEHLRADELAEDSGGGQNLAYMPPVDDGSSEPKRLEKGLRNILVVEDNDEIRQYLKDKLSVMFNVLECSNGSEAIEVLHRMEIDLVISDVMMPVMDGVELCRRIKSSQEINHIPVILLTAHVSDVHVKDGLSVGADDYIFKPFNFDLLLVRINNILENNERLRRTFGKRVNPDDMNVEVKDYDETFLRRCYDFLNENLSNPDITIEDFGNELGMSRVHLYRKIKYLTNLSPSRFILSMRLRIAADLLAQEGVAVSDVCYRVGFNNLSYFTRSFKEVYGVTPTEYRRNNNL